MRLRWLVTIFATLLLTPAWVWSQDTVEFFPLDDLRPGMRGVGKTVFEGDKIEEFQVEILGVLKNALAPKHNVILARLSGGPLEKTGVIAGMSGSPVYVEGKLLGAVALAFPFSKEPLTGITPIQEMVEVVPVAGTPAESPARQAPSVVYGMARMPGLSGEMRLIPAEDGLAPWDKLLSAAGESGGLAGLRLPLRFGGFDQSVVEAHAPLFRQMGFEPMQGGVLSGGESSEPSSTELAPGSMISLLLVRGDLNLNVDCTVTYRQGDNLYACGHRFLLTGPARIPFAPARVVATVSSLASSFKLSTPGPLAGSIQQDRFGAIYGVVGESAPQIPVQIKLESTLNRTTNYRFEVVQEPFLTPLLLNLALVSTLSATERMIGPATLELKGQIRLAGGETVDLEDVVSADLNAASAAGMAVSTPLSYLLASGFPDLRVEGVDLTIISRNEKRMATLEQVWSSKSEVRPGESIEVFAVLRAPSGETIVEKIPVVIPESVSDKVLSLVVGSGSAINLLQGRLSPLATTPRDLRQLVRALNRLRRNNRLYALLMSPQRSFVMQGDEYPSPPPSLVQTLLADPAVSSSVMLSNTSVVGDFETKASPYAFRGQNTLLLRVAIPGSYQR